MTERVPTQRQPEAANPNNDPPVTSAAPLVPSSLLATASFWCGVFALVLIPLAPATLLPAILAILFGHLAIRRVSAAPETLRGLGVGRMGLFFGCLGLLCSVLWMPYQDSARRVFRAMAVVDQNEKPAGQAEGVIDAPAVALVAGEELNYIERRFAVIPSDEVTAELQRECAKTLTELLEDALLVDGGKGLHYDVSRLDVQCRRNHGVVMVVNFRDVSKLDEEANAVVRRAAWLAAARASQQHPEVSAESALTVAVVAGASFLGIETGKVPAEGERVDSFGDFTTAPDSLRNALGE